MYFTNNWGTAPYDSTRLINTNSGAYLTTGGVWTNSSDRNLKENFNAVNPDDILNRVARLEISEWNYTAENPGIRHLGPVAQDFFREFGLGYDDKSITTVDVSGVALAAIQALYAKTREVESLKERVARLEKMLETILNQNDQSSTETPR